MRYCVGWEELRFLRLDTMVESEYVGLQGVCCPFDELFELRLTTLGPGPPAHTGEQSPFSESRHRFRFRQKAYCLGAMRMTIDPMFASSPDPFALVTLFVVPYLLVGLAILAMVVNMKWGRGRLWGFAIGAFSTVCGGADLALLHGWGEHSG